MTPARGGAPAGADALASFREQVRALADRTSVAVVAQGAGLSDETVYAVLRGAPVSARTVKRLTEYVSRPRPDVVVQEHDGARVLVEVKNSRASLPEGGEPPGDAPTSGTSSSPDDDDQDPRYWAGYLAATNELVGDVAELLRTTQRMAASANSRLSYMLAHRGVWQADSLRARELRRAAATGITTPQAVEASEAPAVDRLPETEEELRALALEALAARRRARDRTAE